MRPHVNGKCKRKKKKAKNRRQLISTRGRVLSRNVAIGPIFLERGSFLLCGLYSGAMSTPPAPHDFAMWARAIISSNGPVILGTKMLPNPLCRLA